MVFQKGILLLDSQAEVERICSFIQQQVDMMKRDGIVIGLSGGIDSALAAALSVKTVGKKKVLGLLLPEKESNSVSEQYSRKQAEQLGIATIKIDITPTLEGFGTYQKRDDVIRKYFPEYDDKYKSKIALPDNLLERDAFNFFTLKIEDEEGNIKSARLDIRDMRSIVAATDTKQRTRMMHIYYYAEMNNYLVCGTTNRSEDVQGFFVKFGDGGVDIEPLAHLYKTQIFQLAKYMGVIKEIQERVPSPDTFSFTVSDEEFYFRMPYNILDLLLYAWENGIIIEEVSKAMDLTEEQIRRAYRDFTSKANATKHLHSMPPVLN